MKLKFWIDFEGYCSIEAEDIIEAERIFWEGNWNTSPGIENESIKITDICNEDDE